MPAFTEVPAVVGAGLYALCLLPALSTDVVDAKARFVASGSNAIRKGFLKPRAKVSLQLFPLAARPASLHRSLFAPVDGLDAGIPPSRLMRKTLPSRIFRSRAASFSCWHFVPSA